MGWKYTPTHFDGIDLTATPFADVDFRITELSNSPAYARRDTPISAPIIGRGSQRVRGQPEPGTWVLGVLLDGDTEAKAKAFKETFSPDRGLVYLRANDGDGANWRVACAVVQIRAGAGPLSWQVELDIPNPTWEENSLDSQAAGSTSGDSVTVSVTNAGDRALLPLVQIKPREPKTTIVHDWKYSMRGFIVNRCSYWVADKAMQLFSNSDGGDNYDTGDLVASSAHKAQLNGAANVGDATVNYDTEMGDGLDSPDGMAFLLDVGGGNAQLYYTGNTGTQLTGCVWGIGGTSPTGTFPNNAVIFRSRMLVDGTDLQVWLDGVRQEDVYLADIATANTKIVIPVTMPPMKALTLRSAMTSGSPADGADLEVLEDISDLESPGMIVIGDELIPYQALDLRNRKFTTVERGAWGTTAASHSAGATVYRCDHTYVIAHGYAKANAPESPLSRRPGCQINSLTPDKMRWADQADDSLTTIYDGDNPDRPDTFHPDFEVAADNKAEPLRLDETKTKAAWKDSDPESGKPQAGRLILPTPFGIKAAAGGIVYDCQQNRDMRLRLLGRDAIGDKEIVLADRWDVDEAAVTAQSITPTATLQELILEGVRSGVLGNGRLIDGSSFVSIVALDYGILVAFSLDQDTIIDQLLLRLSKADAGDDFSYTVWILADDATDPEDGRSLWNKEYAASTLSTGATVETFDVTDLQIAAGNYYLAITITDLTSGQLRPWLHVKKTKHSRVRLNSGGTWVELQGSTGIMPYFRLIQTGASPIQPEMNLLNEDGEGNIDKLILTWENPPQIRRESSFGTALHHLNSVISNDGNARAFTLDCWVKDEATLAVDCDAQTVKWSDGYHIIRQPGAVNPVNDKEWLKLEPGAQVITHTEENMANTEVTVLHRGLRV